MRTYFLVRQSCYSFLRETICRAGKELVHQMPTRCPPDAHQLHPTASRCLQLLAFGCPSVAHFMRGLLGFWGQGGHLYGAVDVRLGKAKLAVGFTLAAFFISRVRVRNLRRLVFPHQPFPLRHQLVTLETCATWTGLFAHAQRRP